MDTRTAPTLSADGYWQWDGQRWQPTARQMPSAPELRPLKRAFNGAIVTDDGEWIWTTSWDALTPTPASPKPIKDRTETKRIQDFAGGMMGSLGAAQAGQKLKQLVKQHGSVEAAQRWVEVEAAAKHAPPPAGLVESMRAEAAPAPPSRHEVKVKTYDNPKAYERDAPKMARAGWMPQGQTAGASKAKIGHIVAFGVFGMAARKSGKITVTWVR